ncbi:PREDICTED: uncharacterized protein LOC106119353 [Papilio xuthus]|uniref:Uncharacterized protein LOC106119353 n=1 Tax=Papilio xuthus TaxID=66420 RepID=A0AAJ6ZCS8_PAPXU|nr:PREDICTED: uncharacterized protein LOC106119353 [Papilio xuthus]XP_013169733.1 PREDICTED: uncharacterized protein LOC106119353 [Papilio xuthus]
METFKFSSTSKPTQRDIVHFSGRIFYGVYKNSEFLRHSNNIETILSKGYELRKKLKSVAPGQVVMVDGVELEKNTPLLVKRTGDKVNIENYEFTMNRLSGLVAAYTFDNRKRFPAVQSSEALALGLKWDNGSTEKCKLYLSAVSGTEHFYDQFEYWPLICALRKLQKKKITQELVIKIAKIKNNNNVTLGKDLMNNQARLFHLWMEFPGASKDDLKEFLKTVPDDLKICFQF